MTEQSFQQRVLNDLTELKVSVARLQEQLKPIQESRRESRGALLTALVGIVLFTLDYFSRG